MATTKKKKKKIVLDPNKRHILYSPGYGAGWVSWHGGSPEEKRFMLEYQPFIVFLAEGNVFVKQEDRNYRNEDLEKLPIVKQFMKDWDKTFPKKKGDYPFFGGLRDLTIEQVPKNALVRIDEYDGAESVMTNEGSEEWL